MRISDWSSDVALPISSRVGSVGSGDVSIRSTQGPVEVGSVGSGDLDLENIGGSITVGSIGSGDIEVDGARGDLTVRSAGSGDVDHSGVTGRVVLPRRNRCAPLPRRSEEHTSELQSLMRISYAVFCLKTKNDT